MFSGAYAAHNGCHTPHSELLLMSAQPESVIHVAQHNGGRGILVRQQDIEPIPQPAFLSDQIFCGLPRARAWNRFKLTTSRTPLLLVANLDKSDLLTALGVANREVRFQRKRSIASSLQISTCHG
jgi:hypothetical protein